MTSEAIVSAKVERVISAIRRSNPDAEDLYTNGQCYEFALVLREIFDNVEIWYDSVEGHIYSKIGKYWYDIRGKHLRVAESCKPFVYSEGFPPHRWGKKEKSK